MKKPLALLAYVLATSTALAVEPAPTFQRAFAKASYHQAITLFPGSREAKYADATNTAKIAFALFKEKMPFLALGELGEIPDLNAVSLEVKNLWRKELGVNAAFWRVSNFQWRAKFGSIFSNQIPSVIAAWNINGLNADSDIKKAQSLLRNLEGTDPGSWVKWQLALAYGLQNRTQFAVDYLQSLLDSNQTVIGRDEVVMAAARMLYQDNKLDLAMKYYDQIPKSSDYWLEALEEKAWIFARLNNFERSLGEMKTVLSPAFSAQVGPESYFLATLANLRECDYATIFQILRDFKARNQTRLIEIQKLAETGHNKTSDAQIIKLEKGVSSWADLGSDLDKVPRFVNRDETLSRAIARQRMAHAQLAQVRTLSSQFLYYEKFLPFASETSQVMERAVPGRLKKLAQDDLAEFKKNLVKLQLIDAEAVHRMHVGQTYALKVKGKTEVPKVKDSMEFPFEDKEVWLDEVGHYQAQTKGCPVDNKRSAAQSVARSKGQDL